MLLIGLILLCWTSESFQVTPTDDDSLQIHGVGNISLGFTGNLSLSTASSHNRRVLCMFDKWAIYRLGRGKFSVDDVDVTLCTHLVIRLYGIKTEGGTGNYKLDERDTYDMGIELFRKAERLKHKNPKLKFIVSVGGWDAGVEDFKTISSNHRIRETFATHVVTYLKSRDLQGLNVEWQWPGVEYRNGTPGDKEGVTDLITTLSEILKPHQLELGLTLPPETGWLENGYNFQALTSKVDYFIVAGHDMAGSWDAKTGHHSPLYGKSERTIESCVKFILDKDVSPSKVVLGIPFAGRTFLLIDMVGVAENGFGAPIVKGEGLKGNFTTDGQVIGYDEICYELNKERSEWKVYEDDEAKVPFMKDMKGNWVSFENTNSVKAKVEFGEKLGLGGYAAWSITSDDFKGNLCDQERKTTYPLLRTINYFLSQSQNEMMKNVDSSEEMLLPFLPGIVFCSIVTGILYRSVLI